MSIGSEEKVLGTTLCGGARVPALDHHDEPPNVGSFDKIWKYLMNYGSPSADTDWEEDKRMESENENKVLETALCGVRLPVLIYNERVGEDHHDIPRIVGVSNGLDGASPCDNNMELMMKVNGAYFKPSSFTPLIDSPSVDTDREEAKRMKLENTEKKVLGTTSCDARVPAQLFHKRMVDRYDNPSIVGSFDKNDPNVDTGFVGAPACPDIMMLPNNNGNMFNNANIFNPGLMASYTTPMIITPASEAHWEKAKRMESKYPPRPLSPNTLHRMNLLADEIRARYGGEGATAREKAETA